VSKAIAACWPLSQLGASVVWPFSEGQTGGGPLLLGLDPGVMVLIWQCLQI